MTYVCERRERREKRVPNGDRGGGEAGDAIEPAASGRLRSDNQSARFYATATLELFDCARLSQDHVPGTAGIFEDQPEFASRIGAGRQAAALQHAPKVQHAQPSSGNRAKTHRSNWRSGSAGLFAGYRR